MPMDDWLKGVIAGSGAVLVATAWSMRSTEKLLKEAEIDFDNPEFGVTPEEDFTDSVRQNLAVGGYSFNAESPSGDDPTAADPSSEGGPAELFDESVVQDEQDSGVDFMNAENSSKIKDYILVDQSGSTGIMQIAMSAIVREAVSNSMDAGHDVEIIGYDTHVHPYTEDPREYLHTSRGATQPWRALDYIAAQNGGKLPTNANYQFIIDEDFDLRSLGRFDKELNESNTKIMCVTSQRGYFGNLPDGVAEETLNKWITRWNAYNTGIPMSALVVKSDKETMDSYDDTGKLPKGFKFGYNPHEDYVDGSITKMQMMNAESPLEVSPLSEDPLTEEPSDMGGPEDFSAEMPTWDSSYTGYGMRWRGPARSKFFYSRSKELQNDPDIIYDTRSIKEGLESLDEIDEIDKYDPWYISNYEDLDYYELPTLSKEYIQAIAESSDNGVYAFIDEEELSEASIRSWLIGRKVRAEIEAELEKRKYAYIKHLRENYEGVNDFPYSIFTKRNWYKMRESDDYVNWEHDTYGDDAWSLKAENYGSKDARRAQWARRMKGKAKHGSESASTDWLIIISAVGELADDTPEIYKMDSKPTEDLMDKIISYHASEFDKPIHRNVYYSGYGKPPGAYAIELTEEYDDELTIHITVVPADKIESINDSRFLRRPTYGGATLMARGSEQNQGYNDRDDESIGVRNTTTGEQSLKDRRDESKGMTGSLNPHHPYSDVSTMSAEELVETHSEMSDEEVIEIIEEVHKSDFGVYEIYPVEKVATAMLLVNRRPHLKEWAMTKFSLEDKDMETMSAEARRWRLPKTSKGTALYAKRDESGRFTDIQNVARSTRADRARIAANQGVKSGKGDEGERMIYEAEFQTLTDHVSTMYAAESQDLILCAHCDKKMSECVPHSSEVFEAPASGYPVFMSAKDAAAIFAKNKNKLCTVTFMKKDGTMRTMRGRTGVFRDKSGKTIVGTGKKPTWDAKARAAAGYMTFFDVEAAKKAGDNRKGFRMINLNTITEIKAMGRTFDGAHPQGF